MRSPQLIVPMPRAGTTNPEAPNVRCSLCMIFSPCLFDIFGVHPILRVDSVIIPLHCRLSLQKSPSSLYWKQRRKRKKQKNGMNSLTDRNKKFVEKLVKEGKREG